MLFTKDAVQGITSGSITVTFRGWKKPQAKPGGRYRNWGMLIEVDDVRSVLASEITDDDARRAGADSAVDILERLGDAAIRPVVRVDFHYVGADDRIARRNVEYLDDDRRASIQARLERLDRASTRGPWTTETLLLIASLPGVVSTVLASQLNTERPAFKLNVRKLKELGLTESLEVGYRLSPLGEAFTTALAVDREP